MHWKVTAGRPLGAAALALALAACARGGGEVAIGTAGPFEEGYARMVRRAVEMAVDEINAGGGVRGTRLSVEAQDDGGDGVKAAQIAEQFLADDRVKAVVGHANSGAMVGAARVYDRGLVAVIPSATSPELTGVSPWVYRVTTNDSTNGANLARFAAGLRPKRVAVLYENNTYGRGLAAAFRAAYPGELVGVDPIGGDGKRVEPFVSYYRQVAPDLVFVAGTEISGQALLREARRQGFATRWVAGDGWSGVVTDTAASEGVYVAVPFSIRDTRAEAVRFVDAFRTRYGVEPDANAAMAYDATKLLAKAMTEVGFGREAIRGYLATVHGGRAFSGVTGPLRFRPDRDPDRGGFVMTQARGGTLVPLEAR
ncbi:MAG TPA: ABC transporter substrate-binding protein [Longimicrobium sp.]|uniref:ABC transporter substrate-binding protein n=1 Tax=Longimicrobium sp. TaxID=2029185 RepID=UPI002EDB1803